MNLTGTMDALEALGNAVEWPGDLPPNVYRWWEPSMRLPALYHWMTPGSTERPDDCTVRDTLRITVSIAPLPSSTSGEDATTLEELGDAYVAAVDAALATRDALGPVRTGSGVSKRLGLGLATDKLGDTNVLVLEIPLELALDSTIP